MAASTVLLGCGHGSTRCAAAPATGSFIPVSVVISSFADRALVSGYVFDASGSGCSATIDSVSEIEVVVSLSDLTSSVIAEVPLPGNSLAPPRWDAPVAPPGTTRVFLSTSEGVRSVNLLDGSVQIIALPGIPQAQPITAGGIVVVPFSATTSGLAAISVSNLSLAVVPDARIPWRDVATPGNLYAAFYGSAGIGEFSLPGLAPVRNLPLSGIADALAVSPDAAFLFAELDGSDRVVQIDRSSGLVVGSSSLPQFATAPDHLAATRNESVFSFSFPNVEPDPIGPAFDCAMPILVRPSSGTVSMISSVPCVYERPLRVGLDDSFLFVGPDATRVVDGLSGAVLRSNPDAAGLASDLLPDGRILIVRGGSWGAGTRPASLPGAVLIIDTSLSVVTSASILIR